MTQSAYQQSSARQPDASSAYQHPLGSNCNAKLQVCASQPGTSTTWSMPCCTNTDKSSRPPGTNVDNVSSHLRMDPDSLMPSTSTQPGMSPPLLMTSASTEPILSSPCECTKPDSNKPETALSLISSTNSEDSLIYRQWLAATTQSPDHLQWDSSELPTWSSTNKDLPKHLDTPKRWRFRWRYKMLWNEQL